jgi:Uma2 family endonuclease
MIAESAMTAARKLATYADLATVPEHLVAEILFGNLVTHPRPVRRHAAASSALTSEVGPPYQRGRGGPGGWTFFDEPELHFGPHVVVPDLAGWRNERITEPADKAYFEVAPDWVCELLSPSTEIFDRGDKARIYATYGVAHMWLVNPILKLLEAYGLDSANGPNAGKWVLLDVKANADPVSVPPFDAITWPLDALWPLDREGV